MIQALILGGTGHLGSALRASTPSDIVVTATFHRLAEVDAVPFSFPDQETLPAADVVIGCFPLARQLEGQREDAIHEAIQRYVALCGGARLIQLSTDAVYSGNSGLRSERDPCDASLPYGLAQARVDAALRTYAPNSLLIRTSFIYGFAGGRFDKRLAPLLRLGASGEMSWARNVYRSPTDVTFLAHAIWQLCTRQATGVLHVAGERMSVFEFFADRLVDLKLGINALRFDEMRADVAYDTSLNTAAMTDLTGLRPEESLTWFRNGLRAVPST